MAGEVNGKAVGQAELNVLVKRVLERIAMGEPAQQVMQETGVSKRLDEAVHAASRSVFVVIQEGGSSMERYLHAHGSLEEAEEDRIDCARGAYRTSRIIEIPGALGALGEVFYGAVEEILDAQDDLECVAVPDEQDAGQGGCLEAQEAQA